MTSGLAGNLLVLTGVLTPPPAIMTVLPLRPGDLI